MLMVPPRRQKKEMLLIPSLLLLLLLQFHGLLLADVVAAASFVPTTTRTAPASAGVMQRVGVQLKRSCILHRSTGTGRSSTNSFVVLQSKNKRSSTLLFLAAGGVGGGGDAGKESDAEVTPFVQKDPLIRETARTLRRVSWFSWWSQVILTVISSVILLFAKSVMTGQQQPRMVVGSAMMTAGAGGGPSFFLSGCGILLSAVSIVWTWGSGARLSRRLTTTTTVGAIATIAKGGKTMTSRATAANMVRRAIRIGVTVNLLGLLCNLLAAEQIIGSLAVKVLTSRGGGGGAGMFGMGGFMDAAAAANSLQPLDVLVVQANTNSLLSQFCSLASLLYLTANVDKLDPPSTDEAPRAGK